MHVNNKEVLNQYQGLLSKWMDRFFWGFPPALSRLTPLSASSNSILPLFHQALRIREIFWCQEYLYRIGMSGEGLSDRRDVCTASKAF